ncbi:hypothetical protein BDW59DRAFT_177902 [Aspergillus cavernicola]|uniref:Tubby C-terminal-like domain-containing protein n=1 Tax=Aspergillus cavernicola TaxID=176166 RepID=A0ABR4HIX7_9EURO
MPDSLPQTLLTEELWAKEADKYQLSTITLFHLQRYNSASKIGDPQYLSLKPIWKFNNHNQFEAKDWDIQDIDKARKLLGSLPHWEKYLSLVHQRVPMDEILPIDNALGDFKLIWYNQQMIQHLPQPESQANSENNIDFTPVVPKMSDRLRGRPREMPSPHTPTPLNNNDEDALARHLEGLILNLTPGESMGTPSVASDGADWETPASQRTDPDYQHEAEEAETFPRVSDENIVNSLLIGFASSVTFSIEGVKCHWTEERKGFKVADDTGTKLYEARTDGHLFLSMNEDSKVIVEVKPATRARCPRVRMQETAQMVAWIHVERDIIRDKVNDKFRRLLISQNRHEIYLIIAEYDAEYVDYITNPKRDKKCNSFIKMNEYGPWDISNRNQVESIASIILAVTLQFSKGQGIHPTESA